MGLEEENFLAKWANRMFGQTGTSTANGIRVSSHGVCGPVARAC